MNSMNFLELFELYFKMVISKLYIDRKDQTKKYDVIIPSYTF